MICCKRFFKEQTLTGPDISNITIQLYNLETKRQQGKEEKVGLTLHSVSGIFFFFFLPLAYVQVKCKKEKKTPKQNMITSGLSHDILYEHPE